MNTTVGDDAVVGLHCADHFAQLPLLLLLWTNQGEVENDAHEEERHDRPEERRWVPAVPGAWRLARGIQRRKNRKGDMGGKERGILRWNAGSVQRIPFSLILLGAVNARDQADRQARRWADNLEVSRRSQPGIFDPTNRSKAPATRGWENRGLGEARFTAESTLDRVDCVRCDSDSPLPPATSDPKAPQPPQRPPVRRCTSRSRFPRR